MCSKADGIIRPLSHLDTSRIEQESKNEYETFLTAYGYIYCFIN